MESVHCPIYASACRHPHHEALICHELRWSYRELDAIIHGLCLFLKQKGVHENQRVAFIARSTPETICLFFALFRLKAIACPLSHRLSQELMSKYVEPLDPSCVLDTATLPLVPSQPEPYSISLDQLATFLFTSGSSGPPKIACHSVGNHYYNALGAIPELVLEPTSRWLLSLPLFHVSGIGILFRTFLRGATLVLAETTHLETIAAKKISHVSLVPTQLYRWFKEPREALEIAKHSLQCVLLGGAFCPSALLKEAIRASLPVMLTYGMTEMGSIIALSSINPKAFAKVISYRKVKIESDQEIWVGGETLFKGYWDAIKKIIYPADHNGWFATKDLGQWAEGEYLQVIGRKDRQFISGGENIQPEEIERALCALDGIQQAYVLPIEDPEFGHRPMAFIEPYSLYTLDALKMALKSRLPSFMHPVRILPYPEGLDFKLNSKIV